MTHRSRYVRPNNPTPIRLTGRDVAVLVSVHTHRYVTSDHVHQLLFADVVKRVCQRRLRLLWENNYLDRYFTPIVLHGVRAAAHQASRPIYSLARKGAQVVAERLGIEPQRVPFRASDKARGYATLEHHLVVTDVMAALAAACSARLDVELTMVEREGAIRRCIATWQRQHGRLHQYLVPDGAFSLRKGTKRWSFHLEIVRADVSGGNATLQRKMRKYAALNRQGFIRDVLDHGALRAVLVLTNSAVRAANLQALASELPYSRRLFWFGSYEKRTDAGTPTTSIEPRTILRRRWIDGDGKHCTLVPEDQPTYT